MSQSRFEFGDSVRHLKRPEWGVGSVVKTEVVVTGGVATQRLDIRFANAGRKTLSSTVAALVKVTKDLATGPDLEAAPLGDLRRLDESDWLAPVTQKKIEEAMIRLPLDTRDVFNGLQQRLEATFRLYRFDDSGRGLNDWAVAQSGLDDPLSHFNRHELEQFFERWCWARDLHLQRLVQEARTQNGVAAQTLAQAPAAAKAAMRRPAILR